MADRPSPPKKTKPPEDPDEDTPIAALAVGSPTRPTLQRREETLVAPAHDAETQTPTSRVIVVALDHSTYSDHAFYWALKNFLRKESDLVVLVNVRPIPSMPTPVMGVGYIDLSDAINNLEEQHRTSSHALLHDYASKLKHEQFACKAIAMRGDPRDEIVRKVAEVKADAVVMGSRGLGAFKRTILGSVSDYCSHNCNCTVMIVKEGENH